VKKPFSIEKYGALFDGHIHTYFDYHDGMITPSQLIRCTKQSRFNWVLAMSHDTAVGTKKITKLAKENGLPCLPGIEISTSHNHLLAYGIQHWPYRRNTATPEEAIDELRRQDCAIYLSHPMASPASVDDGNWDPKFLKHLDFDGIEWCNATTYFFNGRTQQIFQNFPKGRLVAGTDAHHPSSFGYAYTQVAVNSEDPDDLVKAMQKGRCHAHTNSVPVLLAGYGALLSILKNKFLKMKKIEGRWIQAQGDRPGSIVPDSYGPWKPYDSMSKEEKNIKHDNWLAEIQKSPINPRTSAWLQ
jgi:predicted metal-dependent phosphoesterase TrpH